VHGTEDGIENPDPYRRAIVKNGRHRDEMDDCLPKQNKKTRHVVDKPPTSVPILFPLPYVAFPTLSYRALSSKAAIVKKSLLFRSTQSSLHRISMREASETLDDVAMTLGMRGPRFSQSGIERHRCVLISHFLRMGEWETEKQAQIWLKVLHVPDRLG